MAAPKGNKNAVGNEGGKPKTDISILWNGWQSEIIELYRNGASDVEIRALIVERTSKKTKMSWALWDRWLSEEIEFIETIKIGKALEEAWWYKEGRINLSKREFNTGLYCIQMKNRFKWTDRQEVNSNIDLVGQVKINVTSGDNAKKLKDFLDGSKPE